MENTQSYQSLGARAAEALGAILELSSSVKLIDLDLGKPGADGQIDMLAHVGVLGHKKLLACKVKSAGELNDVIAALDELSGDSTSRFADATPVLVAPSLSVRAQELCTRCHTSYLDFEGNGRLEVGDMFICRRSLTRKKTSDAQSALAPSTAPNRAPKKPPAEVKPPAFDTALAGAHHGRA